MAGRSRARTVIVRLIESPTSSSSTAPSIFCSSTSRAVARNGSSRDAEAGIVPSKRMGRSFSAAAPERGASAPFKASLSYH